MNADEISNLTLVVAACTLLTTFWQGYLARRHNTLSVRPRLSWNRSYVRTATGAEITFTLTNNGVGPAIVQERFFGVKGARYVPEHPEEDDEVAQFVRSVVPANVQYALTHHGLPYPDTTLPAGHATVVAQLQFPGLDSKAVERLMRELGVEFVVRYHSMYNEEQWLRA